MAKKRLWDVTGIEVHVAEKPEPDIKLHCPFLKGGGTLSILSCLLKCPKARLLKCKTYEKVFPELLDFVIPEKYLEKYGELTKHVPMGLRKRRVRRAIPVQQDQ